MPHDRLTQQDVAQNITARIDPESMPTCPLCDDPLFDDREVALVKGYDMIGLAHVDCLTDDRD